MGNQRSGRVRVLIYGLNFHPELTGVGKYTSELAAWLAARGHEVRVICAPPYYPGWALHSGHRNRWAREVWRPNGSEVEIRRCPLWIPARPRAWRRVLHLVSFAASSLPVLIGQLGWRPDVLVAIAPTFACAPAALLFSSLSGCRSWLHVQDFELEAALGTGMLERKRLARWAAGVKRFLLRRFDRLSTISEEMLARLRAKSGRADVAILFTNWIDVHRYAACPGDSAYRGELGCKAGDILVLYSGSIGEKQGMETLLDAAAQLAGSPHIRFVICGDGPGKAALASRYASLANVSWQPLQPSERLPELLAAADIHVLPQRAAIADAVMPSKLLGIMASGKPAVATAGTSTEIGRALDGRGVLVAPGDALALAQSIEALSRDPARRAGLGRAAREYVERHFAQDRVLRSFESEIIQLAKALP